VITEKPTTPQTCSYTTLWFVADNDACIKFSLFSDTDVSQGSSTTPLRCGGIVNDDFVAYLLLNLSVKKIWKSVNIWRSCGQYCSALFFWLTVYYTHAMMGALSLALICIYLIYWQLTSAAFNCNHSNTLQNVGHTAKLNTETTVKQRSCPVSKRLAKQKFST